MSQYEAIKELYRQHPEVDLSFYSTHTLSLRTHLAAWVEQQDWASVISKSDLPGFQQIETEIAGRRLFDEALTQLALLRETAQLELGLEGSGTPVLLQHLELSLKKTYDIQPLQFVRDVATCLAKEQELLSTVMATSDASDSSTTPLVDPDKMKKHAGYCKALANSITQHLNVAFLLQSHWKDDIVDGKNEERDLFLNGQMFGVPWQAFLEQREKVDKFIKDIVRRLETLLGQVKLHVNRVWKRAQLHSVVSRLPEDAVNPTYVEELCDCMCECLGMLMKYASSQQMEQVEMIRVKSPSQTARTGSFPVPTPSLKSQLDTSLKQLLDKYLEILLVVFDHPNTTLMMEKKNQAGGEDGNSSKKFDTTVGILGGQGFGPDVSIRAVEIYLCHAPDLEDARQHSTEPATKYKIMTDSRADKRRPEEDPALPYKKKYEGVHVGGLSRKDSKLVYRQIYHAVYNVTIWFSLPQWEFTKQTISFPILIRTGAVQAAEHIGVQLCHSFAAKNVLDPAVGVPTTMKIDDLIQMMHERIRGIGGRGLNPYEREFLKEKLGALQKNGKGKTQKQEIKLEAFTKDHVMLPSQFGDGSEQMGFSLWGWFHAIINLLEERIRQPWLDGVIYGFASRAQCERALMDEEEGTFLLRFSESTVAGNHEKSEGGLGLVGKICGDVRFALPIEAERIKREGLAACIRAIQVNGQGFCKVLDSPHDINFLDQYSHTQSEEQPQTRNRYLDFQRQEMVISGNIARMSLNSPNPMSPSVGSPASEAPSESKRRKIPKRRDTGDSSLSQPMSPDSVSMDGQFYPVGVVVPSSCVNGIPTTAGNIPTMVTKFISSNAALSRSPKQEMVELQQVPLPAANMAASDSFLVGSVACVQFEALQTTGLESFQMLPPLEVDGQESMFPDENEIPVFNNLQNLTAQEIVDMFNLEREPDNMVVEISQLQTPTSE